MIENSLDKLTGEFKIKSKVLLEVANKLWFKIMPFETLRSKSRQAWLVAQGKSWTMKSKHLDGKAVDWVFKNVKWQPTWVWPYPSIHYIGFMCGVTPIYSKWRLIESCHLQDDGKTIVSVMKANSAKRFKETKKNKDMLALVNATFRKYGYK